MELPGEQSRLGGGSHLGHGGDQFSVIDAEAVEMVQERQEKPSDLGIGDAKTSSMLALHSAGGEHAALRVQNRRGG